MNSSSSGRSAGMTMTSPVRRLVGQGRPRQGGTDDLWRVRFVVRVGGVVPCRCLRRRGERERFQLSLARPSHARLCRRLSRPPSRRRQARRRRRRTRGACGRPSSVHGAPARAVAASADSPASSFSSFSSQASGSSPPAPAATDSPPSSDLVDSSILEGASNLRIVTVEQPLGLVVTKGLVGDRVVLVLAHPRWSRRRGPLPSGRRQLRPRIRSSVLDGGLAGASSPEAGPRRSTAEIVGRQASPANWSWRLSSSPPSMGDVVERRVGVGGARRRSAASSGSSSIPITRRSMRSSAAAMRAASAAAASSITSSPGSSPSNASQRS